MLAGAIPAFGREDAMGSLVVGNVHITQATAKEDNRLLDLL